MHLITYDLLYAATRAGMLSHAYDCSFSFQTKADGMYLITMGDEVVFPDENGSFPTFNMTESTYYVEGKSSASSTSSSFVFYSYSSSFDDDANRLSQCIKTLGVLHYYMLH